MLRFSSPLSSEQLETIARCLQQGGVILMPTDTVYGIAAHPDHPEAIARLFSLKQRSATKAIQLLAASFDALTALPLVISAATQRAADQFWPGPLTLVIPTRSGSTEGIRIPQDATARALCAAAGGLLRCTSANASGAAPALTAEDAAAALPEADILVDGGPSQGGVSSTVAQLTDSTLTLFRQGPISEAQLQACLSTPPTMHDAPLASVASPDSTVTSTPSTHHPKILSVAEMRAERDRLHANQQKLVFTNGCFDILHAGHVTYLQFARAQGDALCIGLNSDASVQRNKGPLRPIVSENHRAALLAALQCVDYVVLFDDEEPKNLIAQILPDVLVKGRDWAHYVSGREIVESHGGHVVLADMVEGLSTTRIIEKILTAYAPSSQS